MTTIQWLLIVLIFLTLCVMRWGTAMGADEWVADYLSHTIVLVFGVVAGGVLGDAR